MDPMCYRWYATDCSGNDESFGRWLFLSSLIFRPWSHGHVGWIQTPKWFELWGFFQISSGTKWNLLPAIVNDGYSKRIYTELHILVVYSLQCLWKWDEPPQWYLCGWSGCSEPISFSHQVGKTPGKHYERSCLRVSFLAHICINNHQHNCSARDITRVVCVCVCVCCYCISSLFWHWTAEGSSSLLYIYIAIDLRKPTENEKSTDNLTVREAHENEQPKNQSSLFLKSHFLLTTSEVSSQAKGRCCTSEPQEHCGQLGSPEYGASWFFFGLRHASLWSTLVNMASTDDHWIYINRLGAWFFVTPSEPVFGHFKYTWSFHKKNKNKNMHFSGTLLGFTNRHGSSSKGT